MSSTSLVTEIKKILSEATPSLSSPQHTLDLIATAVHTAEASTTVVPAPHEVAILKLELRNTKEKINEYQLKMKQMVESLTAAEKVIKGKDVLEGHMKSAVQEANIEISRNTESIVAKDKLLKDNAEYIEILEKRLERNKQATEKIVGELKCSILEQDETIHSLEEKCLSQANESAKEIDAFRTENFSISIKLQECMEEIEELKTELKLSSASSIHYASMDKKLRETELVLDDKTSECTQALKHMDTLNNTIALLKNENGELVRRLNQSRNEVKVNQIRYEKLEKAFAESIQKIMTNSDDDSRRS